VAICNAPPRAHVQISHSPHARSAVFVAGFSSTWNSPGHVSPRGSASAGRSTTSGGGHPGPPGQVTGERLDRPSETRPCRSRTWSRRICALCRYLGYADVKGIDAGQ
jgi:hypothetical protein